MIKKHHLYSCMLVATFFYLMPTPAYAMHISEGILPFPWAALWFAVAIPFFVWGVRDIRVKSAQSPHFKPLMGLIGAAVFVISCLPVPIPGTGSTAHPCGTGLAAILIGPGPTVVISAIALLLQALFLAHGGLTTLGANIVSMGVVGGLSGYAIFHAAKYCKINLWVAAFLAGIVSDWMTYLMTSISLASGLQGEGSFTGLLVTLVVAFMPTQIPLGILEGFVSMGAYRMILTRRPELLTVLKGAEEV